MTLLSSILEDRVPEYEHATEVLRALEPSEHNMERMNARARGSGRVYHALTLEGPLEHHALERALNALTDRHPLLRARIVKNAAGVLCFAATRGQRQDGSARIPVSYLRADALADWPSLVEADMNAGAIASGTGPLFALALLEPTGLAAGQSGLRVLVLSGHHAVSDGTSSIALLRELLEELAAPGARPRRGANSPSDPFCLDGTVPELADLERELRAALEAPPGDERRRRLEQVEASLKSCEAQLLLKRDASGRFPRALAPLQGWLSQVSSAQSAAAGVRPEVDLGTGAARYERARTLLLLRGLTRERTQALRRVTKQQGLTLHGALGAAFALAQIARHAELEAAVAGRRPLPERFALASAVSLRQQFVPPLEPVDVRMAVDVVIARLHVAAGVRFWELARSFGEQVRHAVTAGHALSSWFRSEPRDFDVSPPGVPLPLLSNLGVVGLATEYGALRVREFAGAMATHGSFQLAALFYTFDERLCASFYAEAPSVSRASLERLASRVLTTLDAVASGDDPALPVPGAVGV